MRVLGSKYLSLGVHYIGAIPGPNFMALFTVSKELVTEAGNSVLTVSYFTG